MTTQESKGSLTASELIDACIAGYNDWRGEMLSQLRTLIGEADPDLTEEWKWNTPVWTHNGMVCAISAFKDHVKINFFQGAQLPDPHKLLNAGMDS